MSGAGAMAGGALLLEPTTAADEALRQRISARLHRRLDLAGIRPEQPVRVLLVAPTGGGDALYAFARARGFQVERWAPDVVRLRLSAAAFDEVVCQHPDLWVAADIAEKLCGARLHAGAETAAVAIAAPEDQWPRLRDLGLTRVGDDQGLVTGQVSASGFAALAAAAWIESVQVRAVEPAFEEPETEDEELDPTADPLDDDTDPDPADAIGPPIEDE